MGDDLPLIVTADLDPGAMTFLDELRRAHFPPERNHLSAHLTLFHHLPGAELERVRRDLEEVADRPLEATLDRVLELGRGVAFGVRSPGLVALRAELAGRWADWLTPQDRGWGRPHVTVQNKVAPEVAAALHAELRAAHAPRPTRVEALRLWRYLGGPWEPLSRWRLGD
jgi:2'-5' RNA ligase